MAKNNDIAIRVEDVSKTFKLPHEKHTSLKGAFLSKVKQSKGYEVQEALKDISFEIKKGEFFGIVGRNGSGKSTLLKCMAGVYTPNKGKIHINGMLVPFIELGVGFNPELSGRDNVYLNGALLGFSRRQMEGMYDEIVEFAELEQFMDQKLKNYSSGMQVRLAFSIAIRAKGDILLLDEVLAVGDSAFQQKCFDYFYGLKSDRKTMVLVSHNMDAIEEFCDRALLIDSGKLIKIGDPEKVAVLYKGLNVESSNKELRKANARIQDKEYSEASLSFARTEDSKDDEKLVFGPNEELKIRCGILPRVSGLNLAVEFKVYKHNSPAIFAVSTKSNNTNIVTAEGKEVYLTCRFENTLSDGSYLVRVKATDRETGKVYLQVDKACRFEVRGWGSSYGFVQLDHEMEVVS